MDAATMKAVWENPVSGSNRIARNYIPQAVGLGAMAYCEKMVAQLDLDDIEQAHDLAIQALKYTSCEMGPFSRCRDRFSHHSPTTHHPRAATRTIANNHRRYSPPPHHYRRHHRPRRPESERRRSRRSRPTHRRSHP